ncbi:DJ-1/PfpI family protein [Rhizobium sp. P38BS-XIX]|uniref:DJ-1/PfpI family protein n=1 Tax=Rhizobium sp. P38BS-XIX TaxID=2726740 RepID=UPI00145730D5|nr:DJ-1/PfpI family protein [Rhizobium sp. P38BS-XIX]NLS00685.1 DJ-1/PfpI family protein [Rhizobium sp. P38BS-XIX]
MIISIPVYDKVDLLDVTGPHEVLKWVDGLEVRLVAAATDRPIVTRDGFRFLPTHSFEEAVKTDVIWVPGGDPTALAPMMNGSADPRYMDYLKEAASRATWVCSVCEGALLLAAAGLLDGYEATTHWQFIPCLKTFKTVKVVKGFPRFHIDRNRLTGGGISSCLDESLELVRLLTNDHTVRHVQRTIQYFPKPPYPSDLHEPAHCMFSW